MNVPAIASTWLCVWLLACGSNGAQQRDSDSETANPTVGAGGSAAGRSGTATAGRIDSALPPSASGGSVGTSIGGAPSSGGSTVSADAGGAGSIVTPVGYQLVWHDEFDIDGAPNPADWKFEQGFVRNEELQWYEAGNARVQGGLLVLEARQETVQNPKYTGTGDWKTTRKTADYTSASMNTSGLHSFQYGRFEMRAKIPTSAGLWPAWWTLGVSGEWPANGEIDIMEFYQNKVLANVGCGSATRYQAKWDSVSKPLASFAADWSANFHVWTMDWDSESIVLSLDGQTMNTTALGSALNADGSSPFKQRAYLLLNLALGGINGGALGTTTFPQRYEVDYLRVFQKQ